VATERESLRSASSHEIPSSLASPSGPTSLGYELGPAMGSKCVNTQANCVDTTGYWLQNMLLGGTVLIRKPIPTVGKPNPRCTPTLKPIKLRVFDQMRFFGSKGKTRVLERKTRLLQGLIRHLRTSSGDLLRLGGAPGVEGSSPTPEDHLHKQEDRIWVGDLHLLGLAEEGFFDKLNPLEIYFQASNQGIMEYVNDDGIRMFYISAVFPLLFMYISTYCVVLGNCPTMTVPFVSTLIGIIVPVTLKRKLKDMTMMEMRQSDEHVPT
ncbi:hypothetical protein Taro_016433, partial [Colocasia esculenta]|nr:hypothetical protein [Colocasia esculenta]